MKCIYTINILHITMEANNRLNALNNGTLNDNFYMFSCHQSDIFVSYYINGNKTLNGFIKLCNASDILYFIPDEYRRNIILKLYNSIDRLWKFNINIGEHGQRCIHSVATSVNEYPLPGKGTIANLNNAVVRYNVR